MPLVIRAANGQSYAGSSLHQDGCWPAAVQVLENRATYAPTVWVMCGDLIGARANERGCEAEINRVRSGSEPDPKIRPSA